MTAVTPDPVVVGVDDGLLRMRMLDRAAAEAARRGRPVRVVHAHGPASPQPAWYEDGGLRAEAYLRRTSPELDVQRTCIDGDPADALVAAVGPGSLLVLGDRRRRLASEAGLTTEQVVARAPCPVLVVGEYRVPALSGSTRCGAVVVGVDESGHARSVLARALAAARDLDCRLEVIGVCEDVGYDETIHRRDVTPDLEGRVRERLDTLVADLARGAGPEAVTRVVEDRPGRALLEAGRGAELLVLGHRGHHHLDRVGLGSTALAVLAAAPCPVLVVGPGAAEADVPPPVRSEPSR